MSKANGNGSARPGLVEAALVQAAEQMKAAGMPVMEVSMALAEINNALVKNRPQGNPADVEVSIREKSAEVIELARARVRRDLLFPLALQNVKIRDVADVDAPAQPRNEIDRMLHPLRAAGWGSKIADDIGMLRGADDWCRDPAQPDHSTCAHLRIGEVITLVEPAAVTVKTADGGERRIDRVELVTSFKEATIVRAVYDERILTPLRKLIDETERRQANQSDDWRPGSGIVVDTRER